MMNKSFLNYDELLQEEKRLEQKIDETKENIENRLQTDFKLKPMIRFFFNSIISKKREQIPRENVLNFNKVSNSSNHKIVEVVLDLIFLSLDTFLINKNAKNKPISENHTKTTFKTILKSLLKS